MVIACGIFFSTMLQQGHADVQETTKPVPVATPAANEAPATGAAAVNAAPINGAVDKPGLSIGGSGKPTKKAAAEPLPLVRVQGKKESQEPSVGAGAESTTAAPVIKDESAQDDTVSHHVIWRKVPVRVRLKVGQERIIHFPAGVDVGVPASIQSVLRNTSVAGTVYWLARAPFASSRVFVREEESGRTYLLDVEALEDAEETGDLFVSADVRDDSIANKDESTDTVSSQPRQNVVSLTRFAARKIYAPERLAGDAYGIHATPITHQVVDGLYQGGALEAVPLGSWHADGLYVTAVRLRNLTDRAVVIDQRSIRGTWITATPQHGRVLPAGSTGDTTAIYLISDHPFEDAVPFRAKPSAKAVERVRTDKANRTHNETM